MPFKGFTFCIECPVNARCPNSAMSAYIECTHNSEWSAPGSTACTSCEKNYECFVGYSVKCKYNYYSVVGDYECHLCPEGKSCNTADPTVQTSCTAGRYSPAGSMECYTCPKGHKCPHTSMSRPIPCQPGEYQDLTGQTSCTACANGSYSNVKGTIT